MKKRMWILLALLALLAAGVTWVLWANTALEVTEITVTSGELPEAFSGFRIAHISDLHNAEFGEGNGELLALLRAEAPDIIAITGDLVDSRNTDLDVALEFAREAVKIAPCYYATGNHEAQIGAFEAFAQQLRAIGVTVLRGEAVTLKRDGQQLRVTGVDDYSFFPSPSGIGEESVAQMMAQLDPISKEGYDILLFHRPELAPRLRESGIELILSGHAHGGQVRIPFLGGLIAPDQGWFPEYDAGLYSFGQMDLIVSRGLGNSIIPLRVNNRPEVVMITLLHE